MKKFLKQCISTASVLALIGGISALPVNAYEINLQNPKTPLVLKNTEVVEYIYADGSVIGLAGDSAGVVEIDKLPETSDEIAELRKLTNGRMWKEKGVNSYVWSVIPKEYVKKLDELNNEYYVVEEYVLHKIECDFSNITCSIDCIKKEIKDYKTGEIIASCDINGVSPRIIVHNSDSTYFYYIFCNGSLGVPEVNMFSPPAIEKNYGDIDQDGKVDISDLSLLSLYLLEETELSDAQLSPSDVTGDGTVNLSDLARLKQFVSHKDITLGS